ncbi:TRAP transporter substrate-binding protein DctP [Marinobacterium iners]|uniref:Tripartite ATP-independent transporter solute receptor, DctP family n=1 Tax=Marinobacterium iners DSM 11526 TaxID=1122198 RepID=A0A1H4DTJ0_9GAMM|nr:TRAP transporter substrate-binding protein DctP [Marinobacterium iners]SEA76093.1 tripartite ATP-independent transporter solute receptor, DctP family [Marinobacterium iners DSM 11526]
MHKLKTLVGACTVALVTLGTAATAQAATWRYAFEEAITDVQGVYATKFKEHIEANSDHNIQLFPYGTLGESADTMEQAQAGLLQFVDQSPGFTGSLIPEAQVFFIPYLLPETHEALDSFFRNSKAINEDFKEIYAQHGLELLKMFPEGEVVITTQEPFEKPADLNGVKIRVMTNPLLVESYKAFGATPTPLAWGEVYGGLQTNIIQGQENPLFWVESAKMYEVSDVITFTGHNNFTTAVMANKRFFDGLPEADQALIHEAMDVAFDHIMEYQKGLSERSLEKILEQKPEIEVVRLTEEQRAPFRAAAKEVEAKYIEMTGDSGKALLEQFKQDLEAATAE